MGSEMCIRDRVWGIAYNKCDGRLYFSRWREHYLNPRANVQNEIWSVEVNNSGFIGTSNLEIQLPEFSLGSDYSSPVSDIAFSEHGLMLLAERSIIGDCGSGQLIGPDAHYSRVLEYEDLGSGWTLTPGHNLPSLKFSIGNFFNQNQSTDATGGIDYGYESFSPSNNNLDFGLSLIHI